MSLTVVIRIDRRDAGEYSGQRSHDHRIGTKEHPIPGYVDQSRTHLNSTFWVAPECSGMHLKNEALKHKARERAALNYAKALKSKDPQSIKLAWSAKQACRQKYSRGGVVAYSILVGFGYEAQKIIDQLEYAEQDHLFEQAVMDVANAMNVEVVSLVVHRDETATHCQAQTTSVTFKGAKVRMQPSDCARLQDIGARPFAHLGIKRGTPKAERQSKGDEWNKINHRTVKRLHEDLPREIAQKEQELAMVQEMYQKQQAKLDALLKEYKNAHLVLQKTVAEEAQFRNTLEQALADGRKILGQPYKVVTETGTMGLFSKTESRHLYTKKDLEDVIHSAAVREYSKAKAKENAFAARELILKGEIEDVRRQAKENHLQVDAVTLKAQLCTETLNYVILKAFQEFPKLAEANLDSHVESLVNRGYLLGEIRDAVAETAVERHVGEACKQIEGEPDQEELSEDDFFEVAEQPVPKKPGGPKFS